MPGPLLACNDGQFIGLLLSYVQIDGIVQY